MIRTTITVSQHLAQIEKNNHVSFVCDPEMLTRIQQLAAEIDEIFEEQQCKLEAMELVDYNTFG